MAARLPILPQLASYPYPFWVLNLMEMIERLAYYGIRVVIPIYIAQADEINGLHFSQTQKGTIFFWWALVQSLVPMFSGGYADRYGYKKTLAASIGIKIAGYLLMATQTAFFPFLLSCIVLAFGTAIFKPAIGGSLIKTMTHATSSVGWGTFYMVVNIGGFLGPPLAHFLYGYSWQSVFYGCAAVVSLNFLLLLTYPEIPTGNTQKGNPWNILKMTIGKILHSPRLILFVLIMSSFWLIFMQLFDLLPNFIVDWVDTSQIVKMFHLPSWMTRKTARGVMIAQEWMINSNSASIILFVLWISWIASKFRRLTSIILGIFIITAGLFLTGSTMSGALCLIGIFIFTLGEMLASPKMYDYLGVIAPHEHKALYLGYAEISVAIGWAIGSLFGGKIYDAQGDKANLALRYLSEKFNLKEGMSREMIHAKLELSQGIAEQGELLRTNAVSFMGTVTGMDPNQVTETLWNMYKPYELWHPFISLGLLAGISMAIYGIFAKKWDPKEV